MLFSGLTDNTDSQEHMDIRCFAGFVLYLLKKRLEVFIIKYRKKVMKRE